jgi:hypothetical protein
VCTKLCTKSFRPPQVLPGPENPRLARSWVRSQCSSLTEEMRMRDDRGRVESQISTRARGTAEVTEKNFRWENIFCRLLFFWEIDYPN